MIKTLETNIDWIGKIPSHWKIERFQWHFNEINKKNDPIKTKDILSLSNKFGVIPYEDKGPQGNVSKEDYSQYKLAYPNTIIANSMNIIIGSVGISKYYGCVSPVYYVFKPKENVNIDFYNFILQTVQFQKELRKYANGILEIRLRLSSSDILKRFVPIPPKKEQEKIVSILNKKITLIEKLIANQEKQIKVLKEYKQRLIDEELSKNANNKIIPLKYLVKANIQSLSENEKPELIVNYVEIGSVSILEGINKVETVYFKDSPSRARRITRIGDVIVSTVRTYLKSIATIDQEGLIVSTGFAVLTPVNINQKFLGYLLKTDHFTEQVIQNSYGISYPAINTEALLKLKVFNLPNDEQIKVTNFLDKKTSQLDKLITLKKNKIEKLIEYKKSLLYEYVTGKRTVES